ncbi:MAG: phosphocholine cytidylyltransferase family protein, partial [Amylibacter sp.]
MKVIMLAAGVGARLKNLETNPPPKILLRFGGKSLLQYHIEILRQLGIKELVLGVGYCHQDIEREIAALGAEDFVRTVFNKDFQEGNIITLWTLRNELCCEKPVLLMDADVLYCEKLLRHLVNSQHENCLLIDRNFELGDEPVKVCVRDNEIVEFRKWLNVDFDFCGESVGFFKLSSEVARKVIEQTQLYLSLGRRDEPYEETIRDVLLTSPRGTFGFEDITGMPWTEIDFAADVERANSNVLPRILKMQDKRYAQMTT